MTRARALRILGRVALLVAVVVLGTELGLRALGLGARSPSGYPEGLYAAAPDAGFALARDFAGEMADPAGGAPIPLATNADGFRDATFGPKPPGTLRVLALGDSFAFGHGVRAEQSYPEQLERLLARPERAVEVLNLGVPGYNTAQELAQLRRLGAELAPDLVLVGCYLGNDLSGNLERRQALPRPRHGVLVAAELGEPEWRVTLRADILYYSRIARGLQAWSRTRHLHRVQSEGGLVAAVCETLDWDAGTALELFLAEPTADARDATALTAELLAALHAHCRDALGVPCAVVLLPAPLQYDPAWLQLAQQSCGLDPARYDVDRPNRELLAAAQRDGCPALDLTPAFRARRMADPTELLYLDVHFDAAGHRLAAEELARFLAERGLVP